MRWFESSYPCQPDSLAQPVEHLTFNQGVPSSNLGWITKQKLSCKGQLFYFMYTIYHERQGGDTERKHGVAAHRRFSYLYPLLLLLVCLWQRDVYKMKTRSRCAPTVFLSVSLPFHHLSSKHKGMYTKRKRRAAMRRWFSYLYTSLFSY